MLDELDIEAADTTVGDGDEAARFDDGFVVETGGVVENSGTHASTQAQLFEEGEVVVGGSPEDEEAVVEEADPEEEDEEEEGEFATAGEEV